MSQYNSITWILEKELFPSGDCIAEAAIAAGHRVIEWSDDWWASGSWPTINDPCVFHGSLGNADRVRQEIDWRPGSFCNTEAFRCSAWYDNASSFLLHSDWAILPASQAVENADEVFEKIGDGTHVFVRPDSPLKPFSGRVVKRGQLTLAALDHGFYYDDADIPVVVAPVQKILHEWRFVVAGTEVVAGSAYLAAGRKAAPKMSTSEAWSFASRVARELKSPDPIYVMDVCETSTGYRLLELNPFSGADLYACNGSEVVRGVLSVLSQ